MKNFACGVVTFYPDNKSIKRIEKYSSLFKYVLVYDNTPQDVADFDLLKSKPNVHVYANKKNDGLAIAYDFFVNKLSINNSADFLCTMDQDSEFSSLDIKSMIKYINNSDMSKTAIIGPVIEYKDKSKTSKEEKITNKRYLISSGSFLNLSLLKSENISFDLNYFIDRVDTDICMQCIRKGYRVVEYSGSVLYQTLGQKVNFSKQGSHSYKRHYYMFRNRFYFNKKFIRNRVQRIVFNWLQTFRQCVHILLIEPDKCKKIRQMIFALKDYRQNLMGRGRY